MAFGGIPGAQVHRHCLCWPPAVTECRLLAFYARIGETQCGKWPSEPWGYIKAQVLHILHKNSSLIVGIPNLVTSRTHVIVDQQSFHSFTSGPLAVLHFSSEYGSCIEFSSHSSEKQQP